MINSNFVTTMDMIGELQLFSRLPSTLASKCSRINQFLRWCGHKFAHRPLRASGVGRFVESKVEDQSIDAQQSVTSCMGDVWRALVLLTGDLMFPVFENIADGEITKSIICQNLKFAVKNASAQARFLHIEDEKLLLGPKSRLASIAILWMCAGMRISGMLNLNVTPEWDGLFVTLTFRNKTSTKALSAVPCVCGLFINVRCFYCNRILFPKLPLARAEITRFLTRANVPPGSFRRTLAAAFLRCSVFLNGASSNMRERYISLVLEKFGWTSERLLLRYAKGYDKVPVDTLPLVTRHLVGSWDQFFRKHIMKKPKTFAELRETMDVKRTLSFTEKLGLKRLF